MKKTILSLFVVGLLAGCATKIEPKKEIRVEKEPLLVGIPVSERLDKSDKVISEQLDLLNKLEKNNGSINTGYQVVQHNNNLDARKGSERTIPRAYAFAEQYRAKMEEKKKVDSTMQRRIKNIDWKNNSANELGKNFATLLGYKLIVNKPTDQKVNYIATDITVGEAIEKFKVLMLPIATIDLDSESKVLLINYK